MELKSQFNPRVVHKALKQSDKFPLVTVTETSNTNVLSTTDFQDQTDRIDIEVNIYAQDKIYANKTISNVEIAKELSRLVDNIVGKQYRMIRTFCEPTPNLDNSIYRVTMKFTKKVISNKKIFI